MKIIKVITLLLLAYAASFALPGDIDTTFGAFGGYAITNSLGASVDEEVNAVVVQSDGKIVVGGKRLAAVNNYDFMIARYNADGTIDTTFSGDGYAIFSNSGADVVNALVIQQDGKIVGVGSGANSAEAFIFRLTTGGTLDPTFAGDGTLVATGSGIARAVALQPADSKIVVAATNLQNEAQIIRVNTNGTLDTSFDGDGLVSFVASFEGSVGIAVQSDGAIVAVGRATPASNSDLGVVRLLTNGALDTSFDGDGSASIHALGAGSEARGVALQSDGKIVVAGGPPTGSGASGADADAIVVRLNSNGSPDTSFDGDGIFSYSLVATALDFFNAVRLQADGKIVVVANTTYSPSVRVPEDFTVLRLTSNGSIDATFDGNGKLESQWCDTGKSVAIGTDGKIAAVGNQDRSPTARGGCTQRFNANGTIDTTFNVATGTGIVERAFTEAEAIAQLPNGKILVAGWEFIPAGGYNRARLIRLNFDGSPDTTFMDEGVYEFGTGLDSTEFYDIKVNSDGSFFVAGSGGILIGGIIVKFTSAGTLDTTFGGGDGVTDGGSTRFYAIAVQSDGKIFGCGSRGTGASARTGSLDRFSSNGTLEAGFANLFSFSNAVDTEVLECGVQSDNKLVVAGYGFDGTSEVTAVSRHLTNGQIDTTFGVAGYVLDDLSSTIDDRATDMVVLPDNRIVMSSSGVNGSGNRDFAVLRYTPNGSPDLNLMNSFGNNGLALIDFIVSGPNDDANALVVQPDGQIIVAGASNPGTGERFALAKLNTDGSPAVGFGTFGRQLTVFPSNNAHINAIGLGLNGQILTAGRNWNGADYDFAMARYQNEPIPTAASVEVAGRVATAKGGGIANVVVSLTDMNGNVRSVKTNTFGIYRFDELTAGASYVLNVSSKRFAFESPSRLVTLKDSLFNQDFTALGR